MTRSAASLLDLALLGRHQLAAFAATLVDFSSMIAFVEVAGLAPPIATFASALLGGVTNFMLSRVWAYRERHDGTVHGQAARYAAVSVGGAALNATLLAIVMLPPLPYVVARAVVSLAVSLFYTYPLHTRFVFRVVR